MHEMRVLPEQLDLETAYHGQYQCLQYDMKDTTIVCCHTQKLNSAGVEPSILANLRLVFVLRAKLYQHRVAAESRTRNKEGQPLSKEGVEQFAEYLRS